MRIFNRQKPEEEIKKQEEEIMQAGQAVEEWNRLAVSKMIVDNMDSMERQLKDGLFTFQSEEYYRAKRILSYIKSERHIIEAPLKSRANLIAEKQQQEGWHE